MTILVYWLLLAGIAGTTLGIAAGRVVLGIVLAFVYLGIFIWQIYDANKLAKSYNGTRGTNGKATDKSVVFAALISLVIKNCLHIRNRWVTRLRVTK